MSRAFISAAQGVTGRALAHHLRTAGWQVRAQVPDEAAAADLERLGVEAIVADLSLRWVPLEILPPDVDVIFHMTDLDILGTATLQQLEEHLVIATHNLLVAAAATKCSIFVHQSPAQVYRAGDDRPFTEADALLAPPASHPLIRVAQQAERRVRHSGQRGLETLIVNTGVDLGAGSPAGWMQLFDDLESGRLRRSPAGTVTLTDPLAAAPALLRAAEKGRNGEHFLLGGEPVLVSDLLDFMAECIGARLVGPAPRTPWLRSFTRKIARGGAGAGARLADLLEVDCQFDDAKAREELGYAPRPAEALVQEASTWWVGQEAVADPQ